MSDNNAKVFLDEMQTLKEELKSLVSSEIRLAMSETRNDYQKEVGEIHRRIDAVEHKADHADTLFIRHDEQQTEINDLRDDHNQRKGMMKLVVLLSCIATILSFVVAVVMLLK